MDKFCYGEYQEDKGRIPLLRDVSQLHRVSLNPFIRFLNGYLKSLFDY